MKKILLIMALVISLVGCSQKTSINMNKDIENMGYENVVVANSLEGNKISLTKKDESEFTQEEMDNIYKYIDENYIKNEKYDTNVIYMVNYKEINIEIKEK